MGIVLCRAIARVVHAGWDRALVSFSISYSFNIKNSCLNSFIYKIKANNINGKCQVASDCTSSNCQNGTCTGKI